MKPTSALLALAILSLATPAVPAGLAADPGAPSAEPKQKPVLQKGLDAETVIRLFGKPREISPLKNLDVRAEKWIYRRRLGEVTTQTASKMTSVPTFSGINGSGAPEITNVAVPDYGLKHVTTWQVTAVLMVEGKVVTARQWVEKTETYDN